MSLFNASPYLSQLLADNQWAEPPEEFVTREGKLARLVEGKWYLPVEARRGVIKTERIPCVLLNWVATKYMVYLATTVSSIEALNSWECICGELKFRDFLRKSASCIHPEILRSALIEQVERTIEKLKIERKLHRIYRLIQWYLWGAEHYPELGFCVLYAQELDEMVIPGNEKGQAVRSQDVERGALHPLLEVPLITHALRDDTGQAFEHYQQRAAVALAQAYGRNSLNYGALWEEDYFDAVDDTEHPDYMLKLPRIKKRFISVRSDFIVEAMEGSTKQHVEALIQQNKQFDSTIEVNGEWIPCARPLFRRSVANHIKIQLGDYSSAFQMYSAEFCKLLSDFAERMGLVSPLTEQPMHLTTRRFRYTVGTMYAAMGMTRKELAYRLDHSDLQHVQVYFDIAADLTYALDKAAVLEYARNVRLYKGEEVVEQRNSGANDGDVQLVLVEDQDNLGAVEVLGGCGLNDLCHKFPPWSCYLCPKFRPYKSDVHEHQLDTLLRLHNERPETQLIAVHRADVILAVSQVVRMCREDRL